MSEKMNIAQAMRQKFATLPTDKTWFVISVGFVVGTIFWILILMWILGGDAQYMINLPQLLKQLALLMVIYVFAVWLFKRWMGIRWSNQHWFPKTIMFLMNSCWGIALSAIAYNIFVFIFLRK